MILAEMGLICEKVNFGMFSVYYVYSHSNVIRALPINTTQTIHADHIGGGGEEESMDPAKVSEAYTTLLPNYYISTAYWLVEG